MPNLSRTDTISESAALPSDLKIQNRYKVLRLFRDGKEHTASDISSATNISKLTVMRAIRFFCDKNILTTIGKRAATEVGGKRPEYFKLNINKYLLHITLWPGNLCVSVFDMSCHLKGQTSYSCILPSTFEDTITLLASKINGTLEEMKIEKSTIYGACLSTSGSIDYRKKTLKYNSQAPEWGTNIPIADNLRTILTEDTYIFVENAGKSAGRSVLQNHNIEGQRTLVLFTTWGISACLIQNGQILNGRNSLVGEIGHMKIDNLDTEVCGCGGTGCFERMVDIGRIRKKIAANLPPANSVLARMSPHVITLDDLFRASDNDDAYAQKYVAYLAECFATVLHNISLVFDPDNIVFLGDYANASLYFNNYMIDKMREFRYYSSEKAFNVIYDNHSLLELDAVGGSLALVTHFFSDQNLYIDES